MKGKNLCQIKVVEVVVEVDDEDKKVTFFVHFIFRHYLAK